MTDLRAPPFSRLAALAVIGVAGGTALAFAAAPAPSAGKCLTEQDIDAEFGVAVRAGAATVDASRVADRTTCSGRTIAQEIQLLRQRSFPKPTPPPPMHGQAHITAANVPILRHYVGKFTQDKIGGYTFFRHPEVVAALNGAGVSADLRRTVESFELSGPIESDGDVIVVQGCRAHFCDEFHFRFFLNSRTGAAAMCSFARGTTWYLRGSRARLQSSAPCPKSLSASPASVRASVDGNTARSATAPAVGTGRIWGEFSYPSDYVPQDMVACAENVATRGETCARRSVVQGRSVFYSIWVPPGQYRVYARTGDAPGKKAYYSRAVVCGKGVGGDAKCRDHTPVTVTITAGGVVSNVNPQDWYAN